jgi:hypothetical protein
VEGNIPPAGSVVSQVEQSPPNVSPLHTSRMRKSSSIFGLVRLSSSDMYIQRLHARHGSKSGKMVYVAYTPACAIYVTRWARV